MIHLNIVIATRALAQRSNPFVIAPTFSRSERTESRSYCFARLLAMTLLFIFLTNTTSLAHPKSSLLWEISGNGLKRSSYLYGTVHSFDERAFRFAKLAESKISQCDALAWRSTLIILAM